MSAVSVDVARTAHTEFLAANAGLVSEGEGRLVTLQGTRVRLLPGTGVGDPADAFGGLLMFVAPEADPRASVPRKRRPTEGTDQLD